jgi:hypothetical protein
MSFRELIESSHIKLKGNASDKKKAQKLADEYDWYTAFIDNNKQQKEAEDKNEEILKQLKELGVTSIINSKFQDYSGDIVTRTIDIK